MKLRTGDPWMSGKEYGQSLHGLTLNILVADLETALAFQRDVLGVDIIYSDPDFAVCSGYGSEWMLHADHAFDKHPMGSRVNLAQLRGAGIELRLHGCNPDKAEAAARRFDFEVLSPSTDKGHGLREVHICDNDGYVWVPDSPI
jgi:catechol 2,3-dioxygenase-like lactoylglutathione lyase family enzyme